MSSPARRAELRAERALREEAYELETQRLAGRSIWERIDDLDVDSDLKQLLHEITDKLEMKANG